LTIGFSKTFPFDRLFLSRLLRAYYENPRLSKRQRMEILGVGGQKSEAMVAWMRMIGLRDNRKKELTTLGKIILQNDPNLEKLGTQFLIHYKLSSNAEAEVWFAMTNKFLPTQTAFSRKDALSFLISMGVGKTRMKHMVADLRTYLTSMCSERALGRIKIIKSLENGNDDGRTEYEVSRSVEVPPQIVAYVLYDYRDRHNPRARSISTSDVLVSDGNIGKVFLMPREQLNSTLNLLSTAEHGGFVRIARCADIDQVELLFDGTALDLLSSTYPDVR
jgi:hypothetical protein